MDPARFERIQELFHASVDLDGSERERFLSEACGGDSDLMREVQALLEEDARGASMLDSGVAAAAGSVVGGSTALTGQTFGPYRLERALGEGGMGVVYLGRRDDLGSSAAIKILRDAWLSPARRDRFLAEQRTLAQLQHTSIARLYDADTLADGTPWFAMEYVDGVALTVYCESGGASIDQRLRLFRAVCEAVQHAHQHAVIHRDLKPSNILVNGAGEVKLLDFGIAKQLDTTGEGDRTRTGLRLMTPAYAAPEQIRGDPAGVYTDVYSLGVVLYELLTGRVPFDLSDLSTAEAERAVLEQEARRPSESARPNTGTSGSWADLDVLCLKALHKDPARRYQSVEALIRDLDHYLHAEPLEARPDSARYRLGKFVRRNRRTLSAATLIAASIAGLVVFYTVRLTAARNEAVAEAARAQRIMRFLVNLFEGGDRSAGPANDLRVVTLIDRGAEQARGLSQDPDAQAELYRTLGDVYRKLGSLDKADRLLQAALDQRRSRLGGGHAHVGESLLDLALLRVDQAKLEEAERLARQGLEIARRTHRPDHPAIASAMEALGKVLEERGDYGQAIQVLEEAVRLRSGPSAPAADLAGGLFELGSVHFYAGRYAESESLNRRVLEMYRRIHGPRHPLVAETLINLGAIQQERGHYAEAEKFHRQALEITEAYYGKDHAKTASGLTLVSRALHAQKRFDEAVSMLDRALVIRERVYGPAHPQVASTLNELGNVAVMRNQYEEAEGHFRRIVGIYRAAYSGKHYLIGIGLANLASVYMNQKDFARAEPLFREALAMYAETLPAGHLNAGITKIKLGRTLLRQKRYRDAEEATRSGYDILSKQTSPAVSWLQAARQDLAEVYDELNRPEDARRFRAERESVAKN